MPGALTLMKAKNPLATRALLYLLHVYVERTV